MIMSITGADIDISVPTLVWPSSIIFTEFQSSRPHDIHFAGHVLLTGIRKTFYGTFHSYDRKEEVK